MLPSSQNLVERHGTEEPLGALFKKTLSRYMRSLPGCGGGVHSSDRSSIRDLSMRDRMFSFCQVPSAHELAFLNLEASGTDEGVNGGERLGGRSGECIGLSGDANGTAGKVVAAAVSVTHASHSSSTSPGTGAERRPSSGHDHTCFHEGENRDKGVGSRTKYFEFSMHSAVKSNLSASGGGGGGQMLHLQHMFGADLPEVRPLPTCLLLLLFPSFSATVHCMYRLMSSFSLAVLVLVLIHFVLSLAGPSLWLIR